MFTLPFRIANGRIDAAPAIDRSFETWDSDTDCSDLPIVKRNYAQRMVPNFVLGLLFNIPPANPFEADIDNNGKLDTALKEVWYNDSFAWSTDGSALDIETVALHENGHSLELEHFGKIFGTNKNLKIHFSPRTVMNAPYSGIQRDVIGVAKSHYCQNFGAWIQSQTHDKLIMLPVNYQLVLENILALSSKLRKISSCFVLI